MKAATLSALVLATVVLGATPTSAAPVHEYWVGTYDIRSDGFAAMMRIEYSPSHCDSGGCMWILIQGAGLSGEVVVQHIDPDGMRLVLRFPNGMIADCLLVRGIPAITGALDWSGTRRGFLALNRRASLTSGRGGPRATTDQLRNIAQGTQSGPLPQFRGGVRAETEVGGGQDSAQPVTLPNPPPGTNQEIWLKSLNENLFKAISRLLYDDPGLVNYYSQLENQVPMTEYSRAYFRAAYIQQLPPLNR